MKMEFHEKKDVWDRFVASSPQRSLYSYSYFLDSLNTKYDLVTCVDKGKIIAGAPILLDHSGQPYGSVFPFTEYQGLILAAPVKADHHAQITAEFKVVDFFITQLIKHYGQVCLCQSWRFKDLRPFQWYNYHEPQLGVFSLNLRYSGIINLGEYSDFDHYCQSTRRVRRQENNKSDKILRLEFSDRVDILDELHEKTFIRQGLERSAQEGALVKSIAAKALKNNYGRLGLAWLGSRPIAAVLFLFDDRTAYYQFGATDYEYREKYGNTFLIFKMLADCFQRGIQEVDLVGLNSPNRGDYKISFNPELVPYFICNFPPSA